MLGCGNDVDNFIKTREGAVLFELSEGTTDLGPEWLSILTDILFLRRGVVQRLYSRLRLGGRLRGRN